MFEASSTDPHRSHLARTAPTPGFRSTVAGTGSQGSHNSSTPRQEKCGVGRRGSQGCDNRIAQTNPRVSSNARETEARQPFAATNGHSASLGGSLETSQFSGRARTVSNLATQCTDPHETGRSPSQLLRSQPKRVAPIDRTGCPARLDRDGKQRHGNYSAYVYSKCRCPDAREAYRLRRKRGREGRSVPNLIPSIGTQRRLQGLAVYGLTSVDVEALTGISRKTQFSIRNGITAIVQAATAATIAQLAAQLVADGAQPLTGPSNSAPGRAQRAAKKNGWAPLMAWDNIDDASEVPQHNLANAPHSVEEVDAVELQRLLAGHLRPEITRRRTRLNEAAVEILTRRGLNAPQIAALLVISERNTVRLRAKLGISQVVTTTEAEINPGIARADRRNINPVEAPHSAFKRGTTAA